MKKTIMFVSHDIDEAVKMGDRIAIFRAGRLVQYDTPDDLLAHPANDFVADFLGGDRTLKRLQLLQVDDAMLADPPRVRQDETLAHAAGLMKEHGHTAIVMVGPRGRVRGFVDLKTATAETGKVGENHQTLPTTIRRSANLRTAVSTMFRHDMTWLAVVDEDGQYIGYVTLRGITQLLARAYARD
jgi:osmoprotectant transport system ATP-binding protein